MRRRLGDETRFWQMYVSLRTVPISAINWTVKGTGTPTNEPSRWAWTGVVSWLYIWKIYEESGLYSSIILGWGSGRKVDEPGCWCSTDGKRRVPGEERSVMFRIYTVSPIIRVCRKSTNWKLMQKSLYFDPIPTGVNPRSTVATGPKCYYFSMIPGSGKPSPPKIMLFFSCTASTNWQIVFRLLSSGPACFSFVWCYTPLVPLNCSSTFIAYRKTYDSSKKNWSVASSGAV